MPTGFSAVPPDGPAIPVTAMDRLLLDLSPAPKAISKATFSLTAPNNSIVFGSTPSMLTFDSLL